MGGVGQVVGHHAGVAGETDLLEGGGHDFGAIVDGEDNVSNTGGSQAFDLMKDHRLVAKLNQWLG